MRRVFTNLPIIGMRGSPWRLDLYWENKIEYGVFGLESALGHNIELCIMNCDSTIFRIVNGWWNVGLVVWCI